MLTRQPEQRPFEVIPAVDLLGEEAVRLERGDMERVVVREPDPAALVRRFVEAGAKTIHVVDLDGARTGVPRPELVRTLVEAAGPASVQASGGVRSPEEAHMLVEAGAARVVVGTAAYGDPRALQAYVAELGSRLVVAVDVRGDVVVARGWTAETSLTVQEAVARCVAAGVERLLCTAVERDGMLEGPDLDLLEQVVSLSACRVLAAGGIRSEADLADVRGVGCEGAIVGRGLLSGAVPLSALVLS